MTFVKLSFWTVISLTLFIGIMLGMVIYSLIVLHEATIAADNLKIDNIQISFNETKFVEALNKTIVPQLIESQNIDRSMRG
jgi:hypothetical protein